MGIFGFVAAGGGSIGVVLGGVLTDVLNWHWIFLVNLPIGVLVCVLSLRLLPATGGREGGRLDVGGAITAGGAGGAATSVGGAPGGRGASGLRGGRGGTGVLICHERLPGLRRS